MHHEIKGNISVDEQPRIARLMKETDSLQSEVKHLLTKLIGRLSCLIAESNLAEIDSVAEPVPHQSEFANRIDEQNDKLRFMIDKLNYILKNIEV